ncbi:MAG: hypothetical protein JWR24_354 [Actinoallomurus sp.]|nr:hypothetical protein [Actinoallomurus sp.]
MRYRGNGRHQFEASAADARGRHRRPKETAGEGDRVVPPERPAGRPRHLQPRDALGRFRKLHPDEERAAGHRVGDAARDEPAKPRYTWRDFELDEDLPRAAPHPVEAADARDGRRHCGALEAVLYRQWTADRHSAPPDVVRAVDSLAELPEALKEKLAEGLDGIYVGAGGVPDLDDMQYLRGAPLPSGKATWDICAGAYGDRTIVVGDQPSPTPDVMLHEIGHALDDIDGVNTEDGPRQWQSDRAEFRALYQQCLPHLESDFHRQAEDLGRHEFFADAFAAIASRQRPALVDMLGGDTRAALNVMLFFDRKYGI